MHRRLRLPTLKISFVLGISMLLLCVSKKTTDYVCFSSINDEFLVENERTENMVVSITYFYISLEIEQINFLPIGSV